MRFGRIHKILKPIQKKKKYSATIFRTGQAAAEMAILGSLVLIAFSTLVTYGQRLDAQQALKQEAFRKALQKSYQRNAGVSYTIKKDHRFYNLLAGFGESQPSTLTASASVMWQKGMAGCQNGDLGCKNHKEDGDGSTVQTSFAYYEVNNEFVGNPDGETARPPGATPDTMLPRFAKRARDPMGGTEHNGQTDSSYTWSKVPVSVWKDVSAKHGKQTATTIKHQVAEGTGGSSPAKISNTQRMELEENIETTVYTRKDEHVAELDEEDSAPEWSDESSQDLKQGAWYDNSDNRIKYDPNTVNTSGDHVIIERTWNTDF